MAKVPQAKDPDGNKSITLAITGDVMLGRLMNQALQEQGPHYPWGDTLPILHKADLTLMNLECVIALSGRPWDRWPKVFHFRSDPVALEALLQAGTDFVSLANNHVLDYEEEALLEMLGRLDAAAIAHAGAGGNRAEATRPALLQSDGIRVAVLAFTDNEPDWAAAKNSPGTNYLPTSTARQVLDRVRQGIAEARRQGANLVIVSNHWGPNMQERPPDRFRRFAHAVLECGADLYWGHSSHLFQGVELYQGKPIFYDTGDFVDDYAVDPFLRNDHSALVLCTVTPSRVERVRLLPVLIENFQVNLATGSEFEAIVSRLQVLSAELDTHLSLSNKTLELTLDNGC